jgi:two-component system LytT family response regulator
MSNQESIRTILVDDEQPAREILREYLAAHPEVEIVAECANGFEVVKAVADLSPELMFLDIQMPKLNGFEVLELLGDERPAVVFVTAYDQYALAAFDAHAMDYLLKPFSPERLAETLARVRPLLGSPPPPLPELVRGSAGDRPLDRILVRDGSQIHVVACHRLDYVEARGDEVLLVTEGKKLRKPERLSRLASRLDPQAFVLIHRSYLLNIERLMRIELYAKDSRVAVLRDGSRLPVSRSGYGRLRELL